MLRTFIDWIMAKESSAWTRTRWDSVRGLKPPIPKDSLHSRSTFPWDLEKVPKVKKKKKKKKKS